MRRPLKGVNRTTAVVAATTAAYYKWATYRFDPYDRHNLFFEHLLQRPNPDVDVDEM